MKNAAGRIVSKKKHAAGKNALKFLHAKGYIAVKGKFGSARKMEGGSTATTSITDTEANLNKLDVVVPGVGVDTATTAVVAGAS